MRDGDHNIKIVVKFDRKICKSYFLLRCEFNFCPVLIRLGRGGLVNIINLFDAHNQKLETAAIHMSEKIRRVGIALLIGAEEFAGDGDILAPESAEPPV